MHEIYLVKVPETLDLKAFIAPITIMTRSPVAATTRFLYDSYSSLFTLRFSRISF
jgi:hypothetical protein